jgi:putative flippase GtrA
MRNATAALRDWIDFLSQSQMLAAKLVRFGLIGIVSSLVFLACTAVLAGSFGLDPKMASAAGYLVSMPANFVGNRQFSFKSTGRVFGDLLRFLLLHGCNILLTMAAMGAVVDVLRLHFGFGAAAAIVIVPLVNFAMMNLWVFRRTPNDPPAPPTKCVN